MSREALLGALQAQRMDRLRACPLFAEQAQVVQKFYQFQTQMLPAYNASIGKPEGFFTARHPRLK